MHRRSWRSPKARIWEASDGSEAEAAWRGSRITAATTLTAGPQALLTLSTYTGKDGETGSERRTAGQGPRWAWNPDLSDSRNTWRHAWADSGGQGAVPGGTLRPRHPYHTGLPCGPAQAVPDTHSVSFPEHKLLQVLPQPSTSRKPPVTPYGLKLLPGHLCQPSLSRPPWISSLSQTDLFAVYQKLCYQQAGPPGPSLCPVFLTSDGTVNPAPAGAVPARMEHGEQCKL